MSFSTLLYRYWFYGWLFRDAGRGTVWQRAAAWRHNREQARWLPTYMKRWAVWGLLCFGIAWVVEVVLGCPTLSALFYVSSVVSLPINVVTAVFWTFLEHDRAL